VGDFWFDRSGPVIDDVFEPAGYRCEKCGKTVDSVTTEVTEMRKQIELLKSQLAAVQCRLAAREGLHD
jgi:DNA-directed RNA polymerase subunit RPC12/RpoP